MKIRSILFTALAIIALCVSCSKKKEVQALSELLRPSSINYTNKDTADINYLVNSYVSFIDKGDLNSCANMLYTFKDDKAIPYTDDQKAKFVDGFSKFHIYGSRVKSMTLRSDRNNQVDVVVQILKNGDINNNKGVTTLSLNPVLVAGKWYLTLLDKSAEGVEDVYKTEMENAR